MSGDNMLAALSEGPARLTAGEVSASQRRRMLAAMVAAVADKGYVATAVADVTKRARVSRATFYEQFEDKNDCFVAAVRACVDQIVDGVGERMGREQSPRAALRRLLEAYLENLAAFPEGARVCLVEIHAAGPRAAAQRRQAQLEFGEMIRRLHDRMAAAGEPVRVLDDLDIELLIGGVSSLVTNRVAQGAADTLPDLLDAVEAFVLANFGLPPGP